MNEYLRSLIQFDYTKFHLIISERFTFFLIPPDGLTWCYLLIYHSVIIAALEVLFTKSPTLYTCWFFAKFHDFFKSFFLFSDHDNDGGGNDDDREHIQTPILFFGELSLYTKLCVQDHSHHRMNAFRICANFPKATWYEFLISDFT